MLKCIICDGDCANRSQGRCSPRAFPAIRSLDTQNQNISAMHETDLPYSCSAFPHTTTSRSVRPSVSFLRRLSGLIHFARLGFSLRRASASISPLTDADSRRIYFLRCHPMAFIAAYCFWSLRRSAAPWWRVIPSSSFHIFWQASESDIFNLVESSSDLQTCTFRYVRGVNEWHRLNSEINTGSVASEYPRAFSSRDFNQW